MKNLKNKILNIIINFKTIYIFIFSIVILNTVIVVNLYSKEKSKEDIFRLHVVANSNSTDDQIVKLKISDKIENYIKNNISNISNKDELVTALKNNSNSILELANNTLKENNKDYSSTLKIGKIDYDNKYSLNLDMEAGNYYSIQLVLGDGNGKNFWSLIFPNKNNIKNLKSYETILPNLSNIYSEEDDEETEENNNEEKIYCSKIVELIQDILKK
jgi:stage II sporulation protein R